MKNFTSLIKETFHIYKLKLKPILLLVFGNYFRSHTYVSDFWLYI